jgi:hypothetical protein
LEGWIVTDLYRGKDSGSPGDGTDNLSPCIVAVGFRNIRDRWLRVTDGCGGDPGSIGEFRSLVG